MVDDGLCHQGNNNRSRSASGEDERERKTTPLLKPGEHRTRVGELRGPVSDDAENKIREIELRDIRRKKTEREVRQAENNNAGKDDPPRGKRSSSVPMPGENTATVIAAMPNAFEIASRCHPKAFDSGSRNKLNVYGIMAAKLTMTPTNAAKQTPHPG